MRIVTCKVLRKYTQKVIDPSNVQKIRKLMKCKEMQQEMRNATILPKGLPWFSYSSINCT
jgi:hypothetical protein